MPFSIKLRPSLWTFAQYPPRKLEADSVRKLGRRVEGRGEPPLPSIAIVTPSFNQASFIDATVTSVLDQDYPRLTYWVQDGGSTDGTLASLEKREGLRWTSAPDRGQAHAVNLGFREVAGDVMAYLNSDDILLPGALACVGAFFRDNPDVDVVYSHRIYIDEGGMEIGRAILPRHDATTLKWADYVPQETMFWRARVWEAVGPLDESFYYALDWDFILRAQRAGFRFRRLPRFLAAFRVHAAQKTTAARARGDEEQMRLRKDHLGYRPIPAEIDKAIRPYLKRHALLRKLFDMGLLRH